MSEKIKKYSVTFGSNSTKKRSERPVFVDLAKKHIKKHIVKRATRSPETTSTNIDNIAYGV